MTRSAASIRKRAESFGRLGAVLHSDSLLSRRMTSRDNAIYTLRMK